MHLQLLGVCTVSKKSAENCRNQTGNHRQAQASKGKQRPSNGKQWQAMEINGKYWQSMFV